MNFKEYYSFLIRTYPDAFPSHLEFKDWRDLTSLAFDCESTGLPPDEDPDWDNPEEVAEFHRICEGVRVVQICLTLVRDGTDKDATPHVIDSINLLINPEIPIPPETTAHHKITDEMVADAPLFKDIIPILTSFVERADISFAFNGRADYNFINLELARIGHPILDVTELPVIDPLPFERAYTKMKKWPYRLFEVAKRYAVAKSGEVSHKMADAHQADVDVEMLYSLVFKMSKNTAIIPWELGETITKQSRLSIEHEAYFEKRRLAKLAKAAK
jgi:DNA polymerase III epsilon subunit-like protein